MARQIKSWEGLSDEALIRIDAMNQRIRVSFPAEEIDDIHVEALKSDDLLTQLAFAEHGTLVEEKGLVAVAIDPNRTLPREWTDGTFDLFVPRRESLVGAEETIVIADVADFDLVG
jgi:hypothetical protein